jgi:hypothetical protein
MAGNALAGLARGLGNRANRGINNAKGSIFGVAQEAVRGQHAAEAQERNFGHSRQIIKDLHKNAGQGTGVDFHVQSGEHVIGGRYTKKMIGENFGEVQEKQAIKDFRAGNRPTRNTSGYRENQPDHVGNVKSQLLALEGPKETGTTMEAGVATPIKNRPMLALEAPKKEPMAGPHVDQNHQDKTQFFANDPKGGTRRVDRRDGSYAEHLDANEAKYLEERKAKQVNEIKQAGVGIKPAAPKDKFDEAKNRMNQRFDELGVKTNFRIRQAAGLAPEPNRQGTTVRNPRANIQA